MGKKSSNLKWLFLTFLKISPITFGGGYAMVPLIEREVCNKLKSVKREDIIDVITVSQTVPGAVAINSAIFIGYRVSGLLGAISALLGIMLPTLLIIILASVSYYFFHTNLIVKAAFNGISAAVIALIVQAGYTIGRTAIFDWTTTFITIASVVILIFLNINPILLIIGGVAAGIAFSKLKALRKERNNSVVEKKHGYEDSL